MTTYIRERLTTGLALVVALGLGVFFDPTAEAGSVSYNFDYEFSSGTPPASPTTPWLTAVFQDVTPGTVTLTLTAPHLTGTEFVSGWYFNLDPNLDPTKLTFTGSSSPNYTLPSINEMVNGFKADGDGKYDVLLSFSTTGGASGEFTAGDSLTYTITGAGVDSSITAASFDFLSAPAGGHGPYFSAAHVQGIGPNGSDSGWVEPSAGNSTPSGGGDVSVPDGGTTVILLGLGLFAVETCRRNRPHFNIRAARKQTQN